MIKLYRNVHSPADPRDFMLAAQIGGAALGIGASVKYGEEKKSIFSITLIWRSHSITLGMNGHLI